MCLAIGHWSRATELDCQVVLIRVLLTSLPWASKLLLVVCDPLCGTLSFALTWVAERRGRDNTEESRTSPQNLQPEAPHGHLRRQFRGPESSNVRCLAKSGYLHVVRNQQI